MKSFSFAGRPDGPSRFSFGTWARWTERFLWLAGSAAIAYCTFLFANAAYQQQRGATEFATLRSASPTKAAARALNKGDVVGRVNIPRLNISAIVFEGTTESELSAGVGHVVGTSTQTSEGNVALAAHRDTFFRGLGEIQEGDRITLEDANGPADYLVEWTKIVLPSAVEVLETTDKPALTLITCYPFEFFGHAPQRFIVRAVRIKGA